MRRNLYTLAIFVLMPIVPWWFLFIAAFLGIFLFQRYLEAPALFFFYDLAYGLPEAGLLKSQFSFTIIFIIVYTLIESYKNRLRFYN